MRRGLEPAVPVKLSHDAVVDQIFDFESADLSLPAASKRTSDFRIGGEHAGQAIDESRRRRPDRRPRRLRRDWPRHRVPSQCMKDSPELSAAMPTGPLRA